MDKASIPANDGVIHLRSANPDVRKKEREPVTLTYDARLHVDNYNEFLDMRSRTTDEMRIVTLVDGSQVMVWRHIINTGGEACKPVTYHDLNSFPAESVADMLTQWNIMCAAEKRFHKNFQNVRVMGPESHSAVAQANYNQSVRITGDFRGAEKMVMYIPATATQPFTTPGMERPFFTVQDGFMGVIKTTEGGRFVIESVQASNNLQNDLDFDYFHACLLYTSDAADVLRV